MIYKYSVYLKRFHAKTLKKFIERINKFISLFYSQTPSLKRCSERTDLIYTQICRMAKSIQMHLRLKTPPTKPNLSAKYISILPWLPRRPLSDNIIFELSNYNYQQNYIEILIKYVLYFYFTSVYGLND